MIFGFQTLETVLNVYLVLCCCELFFGVLYVHMKIYSILPPSIHQ